MEGKAKRYIQEPEVMVGIVSGEQIHFCLNKPFAVNGVTAEGRHVVSIASDGIRWQGRVYPELLFTPLSADASFSLEDVTIGVNFHWERQETQTFLGALRLIVNGAKVCAVNELPVERYLESVISSEMSATSSLELLKAHAVISRSWLLAQMEKRRQGGGEKASDVAEDTEVRLVRWYDREDHTLFDVCADDHCQRYQGITKETSEHVAEAVALTRGQIITDKGEICDARFSKCCGGVTEEFQYCWENSPKSYLKAVADSDEEGAVPDLTIEAAAEKWIRSAPKAFCNTHDRKILSQVLNDYDQETTDFYRWRVAYSQEELATLIAEKSHRDFGRIKDLVPLRRGKSGRIWLLRIVGEKRTMDIGKELEIRRTLSKSHLYSSAFVVDKEGQDCDGYPEHFTFVGAGWGHGVGLCQIGAAVMGERGYSYEQILSHYYPGADLTVAYE